MINLLPENEKIALFVERSKVIATTCWILILFFLFLLLLMFLGINIYINSQIADQKISLNRANEESLRLGISDLPEKINSANKNLTSLSKFYDKKSDFSAVFEKISSVLSGGISLTNISVERIEGAVGGSSKNKLKVSVSGFATTRSDLLNFKKNIEGNSVFSNSDFPSANWTKPTDINFTASFEIIK